MNHFLVYFCCLFLNPHATQTTHRRSKSKSPTVGVRGLLHGKRPPYIRPQSAPLQPTLFFPQIHDSFATGSDKEHTAFWDWIDLQLVIQQQRHIHTPINLKSLSPSSNGTISPKQQSLLAKGSITLWPFHEKQRALRTRSNFRNQGHRRQRGATITGRVENSPKTATTLKRTERKMINPVSPMLVSDDPVIGYKSIRIPISVRRTASDRQQAFEPSESVRSVDSRTDVDAWTLGSPITPMSPMEMTAANFTAENDKL